MCKLYRCDKVYSRPAGQQNPTSGGTFSRCRISAVHIHAIPTDQATYRRHQSANDCFQRDLTNASQVCNTAPSTPQLWCGAAPINPTTLPLNGLAYGQCQAP